MNETSNEILENAKQSLEEGAESIACLSAKSKNSAEDRLRLRDVIKCAEGAYLNQLMIECKGNQTVAAKKSGVSRGTLRSKLNYHGLLY